MVRATTWSSVRLRPRNRESSRSERPLGGYVQRWTAVAWHAVRDADATDRAGYIVKQVKAIPLEYWAASDSISQIADDYGRMIRSAAVRSFS